MFDWQTDETVDWEEPPVVNEPKPKRPFPRWPFKLLGVVLVVGGAVALGYYLLSQRITVVEDDLAADVIASHSFMQETAVAGDWDVFISTLSNRDPQWVTSQVEVVRHTLYFDRSAFGMAWQPAPAPSTVISVTFTPELNQAELLTEHQYNIHIGNGLTQTITLQQTAVYRKGANQWLLGPPDATFWGKTLTARGQYLTLLYTEKDAAIGGRLAADMDAKLVELCTRLAELRCPTNLLIAVHLSPDPITLVEAQTFQTTLTSEPAFSLPSPTLLGMPVDEAGYHALYRGYASQVITAVIGQLVGWNCCNHLPFYRALLDEELIYLGLQPTPPMAEYYNMLAENNLSLAEGQSAWFGTELSSSQEEVWPAYAIVQFLRHEMGASAVVMQYELINSTNAGYEAWLLRFATPQYTSLETMQQGWLQYINGRSTLSQ